MSYPYFLMLENRFKTLKMLGQPNRACLEGWLRHCMVGKCLLCHRCQPGFMALFFLHCRPVSVVIRAVDLSPGL